MGDSVEGLRKQMNNKFKQYEVKLATITSINSALQKENEELRQKLDKASAPKTVAEEELDGLREEFAKRLGALDRTIAELKKEREQLLDRLDDATVDTSEIEKQLSRKEEEIKRLRTEVQSLARCESELETSLKGANSQLKQIEAEKDALNSQVTQLEARLAQTSNAATKNDGRNAERIAELEVEISEIKGQAEEAVRKLQSDAKEAAEKLVASSRDRELVLMDSLHELRNDMDSATFQWESKERKLKGEIAKLEMRAQELESERADLQAQSSECTKPLVKQLESVMAMAEDQQAAAQEAEEKLHVQLSDAQEQLRVLQLHFGESEGRLRMSEENLTEKTELLKGSRNEVASLKGKMDAMNHKVQQFEAEIAALKQEVLAEKRKTEHARKTGQEAQMQLKLQLEASMSDMEKLIAERNDLLSQLNSALSKKPTTPRPSSYALASQTPELQHPPLGNLAQNRSASMGSFADGSEFDSEFENIFAGNVAGNSVLDAGQGTGGSAGRVAVLEKKLASMEMEGNRKMEQLHVALQRAEKAEGETSASLSTCQKDLSDLQAKHDIALELLGERNEKVEQLDMDILEMKEIFHQQLEVCVEQLNDAKQELQALKDKA